LFCYIIYVVDCFCFVILYKVTHAFFRVGKIKSADDLNNNNNNNNSTLLLIIEIRISGYVTKVL